MTRRCHECGSFLPDGPAPAAPAPLIIKPTTPSTCMSRGYEMGERCDDTADCAKNGCAEARAAAPAPDADGLIARLRILRAKRGDKAWGEAANALAAQAAQIAYLRAQLAEAQDHALRMARGAMQAEGRAERAEDERDKLLAVVKELVACKDLKEELDKLREPAPVNASPQHKMERSRRAREVWNEYEHRKPPAWAAARALVQP